MLCYITCYFSYVSCSVDLYHMLFYVTLYNMLGYFSFDMLRIMG